MYTLHSKCAVQVLATFVYVPIHPTCAQAHKFHSLRKSLLRHDAHTFAGKFRIHNDIIINHNKNERKKNKKKHQKLYVRCTLSHTNNKTKQK